MFEMLYCGRCGKEDVPKEKVEYTEDYINNRNCISITMIGRCPHCGEIVGDKHFFEYSHSQEMNEKEIELFRKKILTRPSKYDII